MKLKAIFLFSLIFCSFFKSNEIQAMEPFKKELVSITQPYKSTLFVLFLLAGSYLINNFKPFTFCHSAELKMFHFGFRAGLGLIYLLDCKFSTKYIRQILFLYSLYNFYKLIILGNALDFTHNVVRPITPIITNNDLNESLFAIDGGDGVHSFGSALVKAITNNNHRLVDNLLSRKVDLDTEDIEYGRTALIWATCRKDFEAIKKLLIAGANPHKADYWCGNFFDYLSKSENKEFSEGVYRFLEVKKRKQIAQAIEEALLGVFPPELNQITASYCI